MRRAPRFPWLSNLISRGSISSSNLGNSYSSSLSFNQQSASRCFGTNKNDSKTTHFGFTDIPTDQKVEKVREVFDSVASRYDVMNDLMSGGLHRVWKDCFVAETKLKNIQNRGVQVLDVAGGTGDIAFRMVDQLFPSSSSPAGFNFSVTVSDINAEMLKVGMEKARGKFSKEVNQRINWVEGNAECLPFDDESFDLYTIAFGLRNVTHPENALKDAFRVLKKGGRFMCLEFSHLDKPFGLPVLQNAYDAYSFNVIPAMGKVVTGDSASYKYLVESIRQFPEQQKLSSMMTKAGFKHVTYTNYTFGVVAVHSGFKL